MIRAGDIYYPPTYPTKMDHSLGVDSTGPPQDNSGSVTYPSKSLMNRTYAISAQEKSPRGLTGMSQDNELKVETPGSDRSDDEENRRGSDPGPPRRLSAREDQLYHPRVQESSLRDSRE
jgi:hypothetical protein